MTDNTQDKSKVKILQNFVDFSKYVHFNKIYGPQVCKFGLSKKVLPPETILLSMHISFIQGINWVRITKDCLISDPLSTFF